MSKQAVLITGASSGIGYALAHCFAQHGYSLVLVARDQQRLSALAQQLQQTHGASVMLIIKDLALAESPGETLDAVALGERLFALVVEANRAGLDPEQALRDANVRFVATARRASR